LLQKDEIGSNAGLHEKALSNLFRIFSKGLFWIRPEDRIDFTPIMLLARV